VHIFGGRVIGMGDFEYALLFLFVFQHNDTTKSTLFLHLFCYFKTFKINKKKFAFSERELGDFSLQEGPSSRTFYMDNELKLSRAF